MKEYRDHYFLKAKQENYPARSVYKLKEIDGRFKIFRKGMKVLDLGAAPGSWSLGAAERVGAQGKVLACDIQSTVTVFPPNVEFHQEDVFRRSEAFERQLAETGPFHVVMSDMAPQTTGTKFTDQARSLELCLEALAVAAAERKPVLQQRAAEGIKIPYFTCHTLFPLLSARPRTGGHRLLSVSGRFVCGTNSRIGKNDAKGGFASFFCVTVLFCDCYRLGILDAFGVDHGLLDGHVVFQLAAVSVGHGFVVGDAVDDVHAVDDLPEGGVLPV